MAQVMARETGRSADGGAAYQGVIAQQFTLDGEVGEPGREI